MQKNRLHFYRTLIQAVVIQGIVIATTIATAFTQPTFQPDYSKVDQHALAAPASVETSIKSLALWLTQPFHIDEEKTRAIFRWVTQNISYDVDAFFSGEIMSGRGEDALKSRRGVCEGYAGLFLELARAAGIKAIKISGFAKGYGYAPGDVIGSNTNHSWNAVSINGHWKLLDCTWGAGYIDNDRRFHREFNSHYFFTAPEEFIFDHLPEEQQWQLLDNPRSKQEYERTVYLKPRFFTLGLTLRGRNEGTIRADGEVLVTLGLSRQVGGMARLLKDGKEIDERQTFVQQEGDALVIRATPPGVGVHTLRLFAKLSGDPGQYDWILDYRVESVSRSAPAPAYPRKFKAFDYYHVMIREPLSGELEEGSHQRFQLKAPAAERVAVIIDDEWTFLSQRGGLFDGDVKIGSGIITLCAKYSGHERWDSLLEFVGK